MDNADGPLCIYKHTSHIVYIIKQVYVIHLDHMSMSLFNMFVFVIKMELVVWAWLFVCRYQMVLYNARKIQQLSYRRDPLNGTFGI